MSSLDDYLLEGTELPPEDETGGLTTDQIAGMLRRLSIVEKRITANAAMAEEERRRITEWETMENTPLQEQALSLRRVLEGHMRYLRGKTGAKSMSTPYGKLTTVAANGTFVITDEEAFIKWAKEAGHVDLIKTTEVPKLADIKKALQVVHDEVLDPGGSIADGIEWKEPEIPFSVQVKAVN